ncbi:MAG: DUF5658 family protein [Salinirussus sp.]
MAEALRLPDRFVPDLPDYVTLVYALVLVWGLGDVLSTFAAHAAAGQMGRELNPLVALMLETEPLLVIALKAGVVLYAGVVLLACRDIVRTVPGWRLWLTAIVTAGAIVVSNNIAVALSV